MQLLFRSDFYKMFPGMPFNVFNKKRVLGLDRSEQVLDKVPEAPLVWTLGRGRGSSTRALGFAVTVAEMVHGLKQRVSSGPEGFAITTDFKMEALSLCLLCSHLHNHLTHKKAVLRSCGLGGSSAAFTPLIFIYVLCAPELLLTFYFPSASSLS